MIMQKPESVTIPASVRGTCGCCLENRAATELLASPGCLPRGKTRGSLQLGFCCISFRCHEFAPPC